MKMKILGIFVMMLLITTVIPAIGIKIDSKIERSDASDNKGMMLVNDYEPQFVWPWWLSGADQKQTSTINNGIWIQPPYMLAQEFKPTKDKLTAVALYLFKHNASAGIEITVSIRDALNRSDLTVKTVDADKAKIKSWGTWVMFDFTDITVTPETTYYIVCSANGGVENDTYCWFFDISNQYPRGIAWGSDDFGSTWFKMWEGDPSFPEIDFCFITYWKKPIDRVVNTPFLNFLKNHPNLLPILQQLLGL